MPRKKRPQNTAAEKTLQALENNRNPPMEGKKYREENWGSFSQDV